MNLAHLLLRSARRSADAPAVRLADRTIHDFRSLARRAGALAAGLAARHAITPGERVAILLENRPDYVDLLAACWWGGFAALPINAKLHADEIAWILENAGARLVLVSPRTAPLLASAPPGLAFVDVGSPDYRTLTTFDPAPVFEADRTTVAWLFYTSGTTGRPKGAMITHANVRAMIHGYLIDVDDVRPGDHLLHGAPLSHGSGLYVMPHLAMGSCQVVPESGGFDAAEILDLIRVHPRSHMFVAPTMLKRLTREARAGSPELGNLATFIYGGAPMYLADLEAAHDVFGYRCAQLYGQGESPMCITALSKAEHEHAARAGRTDILQSAGTAQIPIELRIGDEEGRPLAAGEEGEIMARGDSVVPGYWANPQATAATMGDGWLRTGDIGRVDEAGYLTLLDRSKDLIISGGANIYPREVEEVLLRHPGVSEVSVVGLADPEWGEIVTACIVGEAVTAEELDRLCMAQIARFKRPKRYEFLSELPKNHYGKILKRELRAKLSREP